MKVKCTWKSPEDRYITIGKTYDVIKKVSNCFYIKNDNDDPRFYNDICFNYPTLETLSDLVETYGYVWFAKKETPNEKFFKPIRKFSFNNEDYYTDSDDSARIRALLGSQTGFVKWVPNDIVIKEVLIGNKQDDGEISYEIVYLDDREIEILKRSNYEITILNPEYKKIKLL